VAVLLLPLLLAGCRQSPEPQIELALGTVCIVNLYEDGTDRLYSRIFSRIREIDRRMTDFPPIGDEPPSEIIRIAEFAGIRPVEVGPDLIDVLRRALHFAELSGGAFDPTIGPLSKLWFRENPENAVPSREAVDSALSLVNWRDLEIDVEAGTAYLRRPGMSLDLGGIAKGYAADEAARLAAEAGVRRAVIDLGGNILVVGWLQRGSGTLARLFSRQVKVEKPWRVGIQNPLGERGEVVGVVGVNDTSIVTSGIHERFFEAPDEAGNLRRFHHLLSTKDGFPAETGLLSVTVVAEDSMDADAVSTALFTLGYDRGMAMLENLPGIEAIFVFANRDVRITAGLEGIFTLTDRDFTLVR